MATQDVEGARHTTEADANDLAPAGNVLTVVSVGEADGDTSDRVHSPGPIQEEGDCGYAYKVNNVLKPLNIRLYPDKLVWRGW